MPKPSASRQLEQHRHERRLKLIDTVGSIFQLAIPWAGAAVIFWFIDHALGRLAGEKTYADIGIRVLANVKISNSIAYMFGVGGCGWGFLERRLRRRNIQVMGDYTKRLEKEIDTSRTSSKLTPRGTTRKEDA